MSGGRREDPRLRVRSVAELVTLTGMRSARLINISRSGASIVIDLPLEPGTDVILRWLHIDEFGRVAWVEGTRCGIKFQLGLTAAEVMLARSLADGQVSVIEVEGRPLDARSPSAS